MIALSDRLIETLAGNEAYAVRLGRRRQSWVAELEIGMHSTTISGKTATNPQDALRSLENQLFPKSPAPVGKCPTCQGDELHSEPGFCTWCGPNAEVSHE